MVVRPLRLHPDPRRRARDIACVALAALLVLPILMGMASIDATPISFRGRELDDDRSAANALGWPLPGEARPPSAPQTQPLCAWPMLFAQVILLLMVPVGWMAPPGVRLHRDGQVQTIG